MAVPAGVEASAREGNLKFHPVTDDRLFRDPSLRAGFAPFNVTEIGNQVYVTYAKQDSAGHDDVAGPGDGFVDAFTNYGALVKRLVTRGLLNSPWGLTIAPANFGAFSGDLLVGNFGDGRIHVYNPNSGRLLGTLRGTNDRAITIDGLWGLLVGDPGAGPLVTLWTRSAAYFGSRLCPKLSIVPRSDGAVIVGRYGDHPTARGYPAHRSQPHSDRRHRQRWRPELDRSIDRRSALPDAMPRPS